MSFFVKVLEKEDLSDCYYLEEDDICVYLGDYTPRGGYDCSDVNQLKVLIEGKWMIIDINYWL